ncbi:MAG: MMPL family transporter, partial [Bacteroidales bacterium]|nr:MMPL family transporter [Bacteroidales bacterium]
VVLLSLLPLLKMRINPDLESYFPERMSSRQDNEKVKKLFDRSEKMAIILENGDLLDSSFLERLSDISNEIKDSPVFGDAVSLTTVTNFRGEDGFLLSSPLVENYKMTPEDKANLCREISSKKLVYGKVVSKEFDKALIIAGYNSLAPDSAVTGEMERIIKRNPGEGKVICTGIPLLREEAAKKIVKDLVILLPLALLVMLILLTLMLGDIRYMLLPFSVVIFSTIFAMGLIPLFGWEMSIIGVIIPVMMIAIANNYGIHFVARYREVTGKRRENKDGKREKEEKQENEGEFIAAGLIDFLGKPVIICALTTIAGIMGLLAHILDPVRQMGIVTSLSVAFALLLSLVYIPSVISRFKISEKTKHFRSGSRGRSFSIEKLLKKSAYTVTQKPKRILLIFFSVTLISILGLFSLKISPDSGNILPEDHPFSRGSDILDKDFGGSKYINLVISGDILSPNIINSMDKMQEEIASVPGVGAVISLTDVLKEIGKALNDPADSLYGELPRTREMAAQYLELFSMNASPGEMENYLDFDYKNTLMRIQYSAGSIRDAGRIVDDIKKKSKESNLDITVGGYTLIEYEMNRSVAKGQYLSLLFAFAVIFLLLLMIFKSTYAGLLGSLPLLFAVVTTMGTMGLLGIELDIVTSLISSVSIGLGVDFTIHLFWRVKSESIAGKGIKEALILAINNAGKGITINALSVMAGFSVLFASAFPMIRNFALLIILSIFLCLVSALLLIPALSLILKPKFLTDSNNDKK